MGKQTSAYEKWLWCLEALKRKKAEEVSAELPDISEVEKADENSRRWKLASRLAEDFSTRKQHNDRLVQSLEEEVESLRATLDEALTRRASAWADTPLRCDNVPECGLISQIREVIAVVSVRNIEDAGSPDSLRVARVEGYTWTCPSCGHDSQVPPEVLGRLMLCRGILKVPTA